MEVTWMELLPLIRELGRRFVRMGRTKYGYKIKLRPGYDLLLGKGFVYATRAIIPSEKPDALVQKVNSIFSGKFVEVSLLNYDRILQFSLGEYKLIFEAFSGDFFILHGDTIIFPWRREKKGTRKLEVGKKYVLPPRGPLVPGVTDLSFLVGKQLVPGLVKAGLPPKYAEELARQLNLDFRENVSEDMLDDILTTLQRIWGFLERPAPHVYMGEEWEVSIMPLSLDVPSQRFEKVGEALDFYVMHKLLQTEQEDKRKRYMLDALQKMEQELIAYEKALEEFYKHFQEFQAAFEQAKQGKRPPESISRFKLIKLDGRRVSYEFTPP